MSRKQIIAWIVAGMLFFSVMAGFITTVTAPDEEPTTTPPTTKVEQPKKETRKDQIERQFSKWDGSHPGLVKKVKKDLNNPASFKHKKTIYADMKTHIVVVMTFEHENDYGATVTDIVKAKVSNDGKKIEIFEWITDTGV